jgi:hypothetical protein
MHYYDNGLFVGQFGQPLVFGVVVNAPGGSGNCFAPSLVEVGTNVLLYHNDEPGRGSHRWRMAGLSDVRELAANIVVGPAPAGTTNVPTSGIITNTIGNGGVGTGGGGGGTLPTVTIASTAANAAEPNIQGAFTISRTGPTTNALTVHLIASGTAVSGIDYQTVATPITIPIGASSAVVTVAPIDDATIENSETVVLSLADAAAYITGSPASASIAIADNDANPVISLRREGQAMNMSWNSVPGTVYRMHYKNALSDANWIPLGAPVTAAGTSTSYTDVPPTNSMRLYKVKLQ